jgi:hypothetical protein
LITCPHNPAKGCGDDFNIQIYNFIIMKKTKTFNQEVEHFIHVLEAEILKKEC